MLDTIKINAIVYDYERKSNEGWQYTSATQNLDPEKGPSGWTFFSQKEGVEATKLFKNDAHNNIYTTIEVIKVESIDDRVRKKSGKSSPTKHSHLTDERTHLSQIINTKKVEHKFKITVQTSLPRFFGASALETTPARLEEISKFTGYVDRNIVDIAPETWHISRLDISPTMQLAHNAKLYLESLRSLGGVVSMNERLYEDTVTYGNTLWQICHYDKVRELRAKYKTEAFERLKPNILRAEARFLKRSKIRQLFDFSSIYSLREKDKFAEKMKTVCQKIEKFYPERIQKGEDAYVFDKDAFSKKGDELTKSEVLNLLGLQLLARLDNLDDVQRRLKSRMSKSSFYRLKTEIKQTRLQNRLSKSDNEKLYGEFKSALSRWFDAEIKLIE